MVLAEGVGAGVAGLRLAAADVAALGAEAEVEGGAKLLAGIAARGCGDLRRVLACPGTRGGTG